MLRQLANLDSISPADKVTKAHMFDDTSVLAYSMARYHEVSSQRYAAYMLFRSLLIRALWCLGCLDVNRANSMADKDISAPGADGSSVLARMMAKYHEYHLSGRHG